MRLKKKWKKIKDISTPWPLSYFFREITISPSPSLFLLYRTWNDEQWMFKRQSRISGFKFLGHPPKWDPERRNSNSLRLGIQFQCLVAYFINQSGNKSISKIYITSWNVGDWSVQKLKLFMFTVICTVYTFSPAEKSIGASGCIFFPFSLHYFNVICLSI